MIEGIILEPHSYPIYPLDHPDYRPAQWIFIEGMQVVGFVEADCLVCAWREGHAQYPNAVMSKMTKPVFDGEKNTRSMKRRKE